MTYDTWNDRTIEEKTAIQDAVHKWVMATIKLPSYLLPDEEKQAVLLAVMERMDEVKKS